MLKSDTMMLSITCTYISFTCQTDRYNYVITDEMEGQTVLAASVLLSLTAILLCSYQIARGIMYQLLAGSRRE